MGDIRFAPLYARVRDTTDRVEYLRSLDDEDVIAALAGASRDADPFVANILATEAMNRIARGRRAMECLPQGVIVVDRAGNVVQLNRAAEALLAWLREDIAGRPISDAIPLAAPGTFWEDLLAPIHEGAPHAHGAADLRCGDAAVRTVKAVAAPLIEHGNLVGAIVTLEEAHA